MAEYIGIMNRNKEKSDKDMEYFIETFSKVIEQQGQQKSTSKKVNSEDICEGCSPCSEDLESVCLPFQAVQCLAKQQFVIWDIPSQRISYEIVKSEELNSFLLTKCGEGECFSVKEVINELEGTVGLDKNILLRESVEAFKRQYYNVSSLGFLAIIDFLLSLSPNKKNITNIERRINVLMEKFQNKLMSLDEKREGFLYYTVVETAVELGKSYPFDEKEPLTLNRHWLMHGRHVREVTKLDCIKLMRVVLGLLKILKRYKEI